VLLVATACAEHRAQLVAVGAPPLVDLGGERAEGRRDGAVQPRRRPAVPVVEASISRRSIAASVGARPARAPDHASFAAKRAARRGVRRSPAPRVARCSAAVNVASTKPDAGSASWWANVVVVTNVQADSEGRHGAGRYVPSSPRRIAGSVRSAASASRISLGSPRPEAPIASPHRRGVAEARAQPLLRALGPSAARPAQVVVALRGGDRGEERVRMGDREQGGDVPEAEARGERRADRLVPGEPDRPVAEREEGAVAQQRVGAFELPVARHDAALHHLQDALDLPRRGASLRVTGDRLLGDDEQRVAGHAPEVPNPGLTTCPGGSNPTRPRTRTKVVTRIVLR
jgi:hypothetical protein